MKFMPNNSRIQLKRIKMQEDIKKLLIFMYVVDVCEKKML